MPIPWPETETPPSVSHLLLLAAEPAAGEAARTLGAGLGAVVQCALDHRQCLDLLRSGAYDLVLVEESFALENSAAAEAIYDAAGATGVTEINFGTSSATRILRQVRSSLLRRKAEEQKIRVAAAHRLQNDLNASISGLLLEAQMALKKAGPELAPSLRQVVSLAEALCEQLRL